MNTVMCRKERGEKGKRRERGDREERRKRNRKRCWEIQSLWAYLFEERRRIAFKGEPHINPLGRVNAAAEEHVLVEVTH